MKNLKTIFNVASWNSKKKFGEKHFFSTEFLISLFKFVLTFLFYTILDEYFQIYLDYPFSTILDMSPCSSLSCETGDPGQRQMLAVGLEDGR